MNRSRQFAYSEDGQATVLMAVMLVTLLAFLGIAIDVGHLNYVKRQMQGAADAAALAAGLELRVCGAQSSCTAMSSAAQSALAENGLTASVTFNNCSATAATTLTVTINTPPCLVSTDPNNGKSGYLEVAVSQKASTYFAGLVGFSQIPIIVRSEVHRAGGPCIYALSPTDVAAFTAIGALNSTCSIADESNSPAAAACAVGLLTAPQFKIYGGEARLLCGVTPKARTGVVPPNPADPLAYLQPYYNSSLSCGSSTVATAATHGASGPMVITALNGPVTLYSDKAYCGGITISALANVTFAPSTTQPFVIKSTNVLGIPLLGGLTISVTATVTGNGVSFYNYGPVGSFLLAGTLPVLTAINLSAPSSGVYSGILFYQDPGDTYFATAAASVTGSLLPGVNLQPILTNVSMQGGWYLPSAPLLYGVATPGSYTVLVAKDVIFAATLTLNNDYSSLANGSPINGDNVELVQ